MNLLIVEDDENTASLVKLLMEEERFNVRIAFDVSQARGHMQMDFRPDIILLDRTLPDADGVEFCRELKRDSSYSAIPVVFVSARRDPADLAESLKSGGDDYVTKPFDCTARVQAVLRRRRGQTIAHA